MKSLGLSVFFFKKDFIYERETEAETQAEGEAGPTQGARRGTRSDPGSPGSRPGPKAALTHWPPGCPECCFMPSLRISRAAYYMPCGSVGETMCMNRHRAGSAPFLSSPFLLFLYHFIFSLSFTGSLCRGGKQPVVLFLPVLTSLGRQSKWIGIAQVSVVG